MNAIERAAELVKSLSENCGKHIAISEKDCAVLLDCIQLAILYRDCCQKYIPDMSVERESVETSDTSSVLQ